MDHDLQNGHSVDAPSEPVMSNAVEPATGNGGETKAGPPHTTASIKPVTAVKKSIVSNAIKAPVSSTAPATKSATAKPSSTLSAMKPKAPVSTSASAATTRRLSMQPTLPGKAAPVKALSSSTTSKPVTSSAKSTTTATASLSSSTSKLSSSTTSKPRASLSTAARAPPTVNRASIVSPTLSSSGQGSEPSRASAHVRKVSAGTRATLASSVSSAKPADKSMASIPDTPDDSLSTKISELSEIVAAKQSRIDDLEKHLNESVAKLDSTVAEFRSEKTAWEQQLSSKETDYKSLVAEQELAKSRLAASDESIALSKTNTETLKAKVASLTQEMANASSASEDQTRLLGENLAELQSSLVAARDQVSSLTHSHTNSLKELQDAADTERQVWQKEKEMFEKLTKEKDELLSSRVNTLSKTEARITELEENLKSATGLSAELEALRQTKQTSETRIGELEVEILELREEFDKAEEQRVAASDALRKLEANILGERQIFEETLKEVTAKHANATQLFDDSLHSHAEELQKADAVRAEVSRDLLAAKDALGKIKEAHDVSSKQYAEAELAHQRSLLDLQAENLSQISALNDRIKDMEDGHNRSFQNLKAEHQHALSLAHEEGKIAAGDDHRKELEVLRAQSQTAIEQLQKTNQSTMEELKNSYHNDAEGRVQERDKQLSSQALELKVTREDLGKAKSAFQALSAEIQSLKAELGTVNQHLVTASDNAKAECVNEIEAMKQERDAARDDWTNLQAAFTATKETFDAITLNHSREIEDAAKSRVQEVTSLRNTHDEEKRMQSQDTSNALQKVKELEIELSNHQALLAEARSATGSVQGNGTATASPTITKEELAHMHDAHNKKIYELEAQHSATTKSLQEALEVAVKRSDELEAAAERSKLELQLWEGESEENADKIKRLEDELDGLRKPLNS